MQEVGGSRDLPAPDVDTDVEACCSLLAQLLVDMWQRAGPVASFPLASLLLQRWASGYDMLYKPLKVFDLQGIAITHVSDHHLGCTESIYFAFICHHTAKGRIWIPGARPAVLS